MNLSRRDFLRTGGYALLGSIAIACGKGAPKSDGRRTLDAIIDGRPQQLRLEVPPFEVLAGSPQRVVFALLPVAGGVPYQGGTGSVWVAPDRASQATGPAEVVFRGDGLGDRGIYTATMTFPSNGSYLMLVEATPEGASAPMIGAASVAVGPRGSQPRAGDEAIAVATPTVNAARGVDPICTRKPACSMHRISLDDALKNSKPTVFIIATPAYCQSRLCGPEVDILQDISKDFSQVNFVHAEVLKNDDPETVQRFNPLSPTSIAWKLESEPVTYFIDAEGKIVDRFVGPMDRAEARAATQALVS